MLFTILKDFSVLSVISVFDESAFAYDPLHSSDVRPDCAKLETLIK
jgi:hypothetical protein